MLPVMFVETGSILLNHTETPIGGDTKMIMRSPIIERKAIVTKYCLSWDYMVNIGKNKGVEVKGDVKNFTFWIQGKQQDLVLGVWRKYNEMRELDAKSKYMVCSILGRIIHTFQTCKMSRWFTPSPHLGQLLCLLSVKGGCYSTLNDLSCYWQCIQQFRNISYIHA